MSKKTDKFWSKVKIGAPDECWPWTGAKRGKDVIYGCVWFRGKHDNAHRVAWILTNGELPPLPNADCRGTCVLHSCDFGLCCNPRHLFLGTHDDNMKDKVAKDRTNHRKPICKNGHPRTRQNLYRSKDGFHACRICHRDRERKRKNWRGGTRAVKHVATLNGETRTVRQWCRLLGLVYNTVHKRIVELGWAPERALTPPRARRAPKKQEDSRWAI